MANHRNTSLDDDLTPWNPAHFGHTDFQKESDGQLTIFFEDAHEPPDPDDFASIADYEIAWIEWETQQTLPQQEEIMFNITTSFDYEIEQLKTKLAELETQKHCANRIVEQVGEGVVELKQAGVSDGVLSNWACAIYKEITGEDVPQFPDSAALETARQEISQLKSANFEVTLKLMKQQLLKETAVGERDHYQKELQKLQSGSELTGDNSLIEGYKKTIMELTTANEKITEEVLKLRGELPLLELVKPTEEPDAQPEESKEVAQSNFVIGDFVRPMSSAFDNFPNGRVIKIEDNSVLVAFCKTEQTSAYETSFKLDAIKSHPDNESLKMQETVSEFLRKLDRLNKVDKLDWVKIKALPLNIETVRELVIQARTKTHKYLLDQLPVMCAKYIMQTDDSSDLDWLPGDFVELVREAFSVAEEPESEETAPLSEIKPVFQRGNTVCLTASPSSQAKILDVNGEWLNVQGAEGLTDMWNISDAELVAE